MSIDKRGPKLGDAASLWNFTPSPGWTKEEAQTLKLCLMKYGIGRWVQILDTGLLPGKLIQQLNGQTQRLLGQQSLAAYTGLRVDIDRIRQDNEAKVDAQRKSGLIIYNGPNLTKEMKEKLQEESKVRYGLTEEQMMDVERQLEDIFEAKMKEQGELKHHREVLNQLKSLSFPAIDEIQAFSREEKLRRLRELYQKLQEAHAVYKYHTSRQQCHHMFQRNHKASMNTSGGRENVSENGNIRRTLSGSKNKKGGDKKKKKNGVSKKRRVSDESGMKASSTDEEIDVTYDSDTAKECEVAGLEASIATLTAMGFARRQVIDALDEANGSIEGAVEWLTVHCVY
eukprot:jgi/Picre1/30464/NNA_005828.t1